MERRDTVDETAPDVLVIEDNDSERESIEMALRNMAGNLHVVAAATARQALDRIFGVGDESGGVMRAPPRLILLDLHLRGQHGVLVLERLRSKEETALTPVVVFTDSHEPAEMTRMYQAGANSFVLKPTDFDKFVSIVEDIGHYWLACNQVPFEGGLANKTSTLA